MCDPIADRLQRDAVNGASGLVPKTKAFPVRTGAHLRLVQVVAQERQQRKGAGVR
jgi:hypothetical protein